MNETDVDMKILDLGGSLVVPEKIDIQYLKSFQSTITGYLSVEERRKLIIVCGGGRVAREYQNVYRDLVASPSNDAEDHIGIAATRLNAELLKHLFGRLCPEPVVYNPTTVSVFKGKILIAAGWKPGFSTDYDAVLLAELHSAQMLINLSNIPCVFTADPKMDSSATPLDSISWSTYKSIIGAHWTPGSNVPFDPVATEHAARIQLKVIVTDGKDIANLVNILNGCKAKGTVIGPE